MLEKQYCQYVDKMLRLLNCLLLQLSMTEMLLQLKYTQGVQSLSLK